MLLSAQAIDVIILAGGRGERLGGEDKGWLSFYDSNFGETTFVEAILSAFASQTVRPLISANRNIARYSALATAYNGLVVQDPEADFKGPLGGLTAAAAHLQSHWVLVVPCDTPLLRPVLIERMLESATAKPMADGFMANDGQRIQPLHCLLKRTILLELPAFMARSHERQPGMKGWTRNFDIRNVDFSDFKSMFDNINTPEALEELRSADKRSQG